MQSFCPVVTQTSGEFLSNLTLTCLQIVFEAIRGKGFSSDIALDDIKITSGGCPLKQHTCEFVKYPFRPL